MPPALHAYLWHVHYHIKQLLQLPIAWCMYWLAYPLVLISPPSLPLIQDPHTLGIDNKPPQVYPHLATRAKKRMMQQGMCSFRQDVMPNLAIDTPSADPTA